MDPSKNAASLPGGERTGAQVTGAKEGLLSLLFNTMPTVSRFYGIVIAMFFDDHPRLTATLATAATRPGSISPLAASSTGG